METFTLFKDASTIAFAAIGSYVAIRGLSTWRRQLRGNYEYELAKKLLKSLYKARDTLKTVRSPMVFGGESVAAIKKLSENPEEDLKTITSSNDHLGYVYQLRWEKYNEVAAELESCFYEAQVIWPEAINPLIEQFQKKISELSFAINEYLLYLQRREATLAYDAAYQAEVEKYRQIAAPMSIQDPFKASIDDIIAQFETILKKYIQMHAPM